MRKNYLLVALFAILSLSVGAREKQDGWKQLGTGTFCDDMFSALDESFLATWDVEIEESETTPGYYRLVNPFGNGNCPYFGDKNNFKANDLYRVSRNLVGINFRHPNVMPNFAVWKTITYRHWHRWCCQPRF